MVSNGFQCFYCGARYNTAEKVLLCQQNHETTIKRNNTEGLNHFISQAMLNVWDISDGQSTFGELYREKYTLILALLVVLSKNKGTDIWFSDFFSDGSLRPGFFLVGLSYEPERQITYLLPGEMKAKVEKIGRELMQAPPFQAHNADDVIKRLYEQIICPVVGC